MLTAALIPAPDATAPTSSGGSTLTTFQPRLAPTTSTQLMPSMLIQTTTSATAAIPSSTLPPPPITRSPAPFTQPQVAPPPQEAPTAGTRQVTTPPPPSFDATQPPGAPVPRGPFVLPPTVINTGPVPGTQLAPSVAPSQGVKPKWPWIVGGVGALAAVGIGIALSRR